jgi:hypothetical protein
MSDIPSQFAINPDKSDGCYSFPKPEPLDPITDSLKESVFFPDIQAYVTVDARVRKSGDFWIDMGTMFGSRNSGMDISISKYSNINETLDYLRKLQRVTDDLIRFIVYNNLRKSED